MTTVAAPLSVDSDAVQVLPKVAAVSTSDPVEGTFPGFALSTFVSVAELVTDPAGPRAPAVLTAIESDERIVAVSAMITAAKGTLAVCGLLEASGARVATGAGPWLGWGLPNRVRSKA